MIFLLLGSLGCQHDDPDSEPRVKDDDTTAPTVVETLPPAEARNVVVLVLDGLRSEEMCAETPASLTGKTGVELAPEIWGEIAPRGTFMKGLVNSGITLTGPTHATMVGGRFEQSFNMAVAESTDPLWPPQYPSLFHALGKEGRTTAALGNTEILGGLTATSYPGTTSYSSWTYVDEGPDTPVMTALKNVISTEAPAFVVVNLHQADRLAHDEALDDYIEAIGIQDADVGDFYGWLEANEPEYFAGTLLVVMSDHGRHNDDWTGHGDNCTGCRRMAIWMSGPSVAKQEMEGVWMVDDLASTFASWLDVELPWGLGLPLDEALPELPGVVRTGLVDLVASEHHSGGLRLQDDPEQRMVLEIDGEVLSSPDATLVDGPVLVEGASLTWVCFREFKVDETEEWRWLGRCMANDGSGWTDIGFPNEGQLSAPAVPSLTAIGDNLSMAYLDYVERNNPVDVGFRLARWTEARGWVLGPVREDVFPTNPELLVVEGVPLLAGGSTSAFPDTQHRTSVFRIEGDVFTETFSDDLSRVMGLDARADMPTMKARNSIVDLALVGFEAAQPDQKAIAWTRSRDGGSNWATPTLLPSDGMPYMHVPLQWDGEYLVWGAEVDGVAELCRIVPGDAAASCISTGSSRIDSYAVRDGVAQVVVDQGVGQWETVTVGW